MSEPKRPSVVYDPNATLGADWLDTVGVKGDVSVVGVLGKGIVIDISRAGLFRRRAALWFQRRHAEMLAR